MMLDCSFADMHVSRAAFGGEGVKQDCLRDGLEPAAGNSLDDPPEDQHGKAHGQAAQG